ncbi:MAG: hypothetical protein ACPG5B_12685 [Chitinophagales bacterium]
MKKKYLFLLLLFVAMIQQACEKVEGEGGQATIYGEIRGAVYNNIDEIILDYSLPEERVYIIYGKHDDTNTIYDDDTRTSYDGKFEFPYLQAGIYTIFAYSKCSECLAGKEAVFAEVNIEKGATEVFLENPILVKD